jgi:hypothetical protein
MLPKELKLDDTVILNQLEDVQLPGHLVLLLT